MLACDGPNLGVELDIRLSKLFLPLADVYKTESDRYFGRAFEKFQNYIVQERRLGFVTPFQRNTRAWVVAAQGAKTESTGAQLHASINNNIITVSKPDGMSPPRQICLRSWATAAQKSIVEFQHSIESLLPEGITISDFPVNKLVDDLSSPKGPHGQIENAGWLGVWTSSVRDLLFRPGENRHRLFSTVGPSLQATEAWLAREQTFVLSSLAKVLALTCGIGLQEFKYGYIRFDSGDEHIRNVWILKNGLVVFNDPKKALHRNDDSIGLFAFPHDVTKHLSLYLYILRPLMVEFFASSGRKIPLYSTNIWANSSDRSTRGNRWQWSGNKVAGVVKACTQESFGVVLTPQLIQRIVSQLFRDGVPVLFPAHENSPVDQQAQHVKFTSLTHYGYVAHFPPIKHLRLQQPMRHLAVNEIWHALLDLGPMNDSWCSKVSDTPLTLRLISHHQATIVARRLIVQAYEIQGAEDACILLTTLPFVMGTQVCKLHLYITWFNDILKFQSPLVIGDSVLEQVTAVLCQEGRSCKQPTIIDAADAAVIVSFL